MYTLFRCHSAPKIPVTSAEGAKAWLSTLTGFCVVGRVHGRGVRLASHFSKQNRSIVYYIPLCTHHCALHDSSWFLRSSSFLLLWPRISVSKTAANSRTRRPLHVHVVLHEWSILRLRRFKIFALHHHLLSQHIPSQFTCSLKKLLQGLPHQGSRNTRL